MKETTDPSTIAPPTGATPFTPFERVPSPLSNGRESVEKRSRRDRIEKGGQMGGVSRSTPLCISPQRFSNPVRSAAKCPYDHRRLPWPRRFAFCPPIRSDRPFHRGRTAKEKNYSNKPASAPCHAGVIVAESVLRDGSTQQ